MKIRRLSGKKGFRNVDTPQKKERDESQFDAMKKIRKKLPPPSKIMSDPKGNKGYDRSKRNEWKKDLD